MTKLFKKNMLKSQELGWKPILGENLLDNRAKKQKTVILNPNDLFGVNDPLADLVV